MYQQRLNPREGVDVGSSDKLYPLFSQQHMLVGLEYNFLCGSFRFGIFHNYDQREDDLMPKFS